MNKQSLSLLKKTTHENKIEENAFSYSQLISYHEENYQLLWCYMNPKGRPCINKDLLRELNQEFRMVHNNSGNLNPLDIKYHVLASNIPNIYNLGGDLQLFKEAISNKDKETLSKYAHSCIDAIHNKLTLHKKGVTHITLVQGDALGGGFEAALAADVIIAEKHSKLGLPEVLFNLFPGMGAYSILSRKIGSKMAEDMIMSGKLYTAEELFEMGVIDILAEENQGEIAVYDYIEKENRSKNAISAIRKVKDYCNPITKDELTHIVDIWVDAALKLEHRDIRMMDRLISKQNQKTPNIAA